MLPSGRRLCEALARYAKAQDRPRRLLEIGPGTGVATDRIIARMGAQDTLDVVELNDRFVALLRDRLEMDPAWQTVGDRVRIHHLPIEQHHANHQYDAIVSGLPLNNFDVEVVRSILARIAQLVAPNGTLSFFEYVAIRKFKTLIASREERRRLAGISEVLSKELAAREFDRQMVVANIPPAWVHHLRY